MLGVSYFNVTKETNLSKGTGWKYRLADWLWLGQRGEDRLHTHYVSPLGCALLMMGVWNINEIYVPFSFKI